MAVTGFPYALDVTVLIWVLVCWIGYTVFADRYGWGRREMAQVMYGHRLTWMKRMLGRDNRMADVNIVIAHIRSGTLFASTSILILAGIVAILGNVERLLVVISELSFAADPTKESLELKVFALAVIFVYAFFKFAWCLRQFNYSLVLIGAAPEPAQCGADTLDDFALRTARVLTRASNTFNRGLRAYYFGLATLTWFIQPWLFAIAGAFVILVLYRRDFRSNTLDALASSDPSSPPG